MTLKSLLILLAPIAIVGSHSDDQSFEPVSGHVFDGSQFSLTSDDFERDSENLFSKGYFKNASRMLQASSSSSENICVLFSDISEMEGMSDSLIAKFSDQCIDSCLKTESGADVFSTWLWDPLESHPSLLSLYCILGKPFLKKILEWIAKTAIFELLGAIYVLNLRWLYPSIEDFAYILDRVTPLSPL